MSYATKEDLRAYGFPVDDLTTERLANAVERMLSDLNRNPPSEFASFYTLGLHAWCLAWLTAVLSNLREEPKPIEPVFNKIDLNKADEEQGPR